MSLPTADLPLRFQLVQRDVVWARDSHVEPIVDAILDNPWCRFEEMDLDTSLDFRPMNRSEIVEHLGGRPDRARSVAFRRGLEWAAITPGPGENLVSISITRSLALDKGIDTARAEAKRIALLLASMGGATWGTAGLEDPDNRPWRALRDRGVSALPEELGQFVLWSAWSSPRAYEPFIDRDALLAVPAHRAEEWPHGIVYFEAFDDPFSFFEPPSLDAVEAIHRHLASAIRSKSSPRA